MPEEKIFIDADDLQYEEKIHKDTIRVLVFSLAKEYYGIDVSCAKEVAHLGLVTRVPNASLFIKGVTNLHGEIIPLVDLSFFLGIAPVDMSDKLEMIIMENGTSLVGILADKIEETTQLDRATLQLPLATLKGKLLEFTIGQTEFKKGILVILDLKKILSSNEFNKGGNNVW